MTRRVLVTAIAGACLAVGVRSAPAAQPQRAQGAPLDLVEIIGCLERDSAGAWMVVRGTTPVVTKVPWTTVSAVSDTAGKALGSSKYRLIGVGPFSPSARLGHKVAVKGILLKEPSETRINVTSLQTASETCLQ